MPRTVSAIVRTRGMNPADPNERRQRWTAAGLLIGLMILLLALCGRLVHIHMAMGAKLTALADEQHEGASVIPARRGTVFDARGRVVAMSRSAPDVYVDPFLVEDVDELAAALSARLNRPAAEIADVLRQRSQARYVVIAERVDEITAEAVRSLHLPAVGLNDRAERTYPLHSSMAHVLGWVGRDGHGLEGVERAFDEHLAGRDGRRGTLHDARRRVLRRADSTAVSPLDGGHLVLTLDAEIQRITEEALSRSVTKFDAQSGVAIVLSPTDGEILAMACYPTFDPNEAFLPRDAALRRNRAVTDPVEPGSTFKPIIACGALDGGHVSATDKFDCHMGQHRFGSRLVTDTKPHGVMGLRDIIIKSSNIGMGLIGERMGNAALYEVVRRFGFGERTGVQCPGEGSGVVRPFRQWDSFSTTSIPIGYEILVTPIQLLSAFAGIVNDGLQVRPRVVKERLAPDGTLVEAFEAPEAVRRVASSEVARYVAREMLTGVVEEGGGSAAKAGPYRVLGKTGTAKLAYPDRGGYEPGAYLGLFVGASPVDRPRIVVLVMVRRPNPKAGYYGGAVAAPVVGEIIERTLTYLQVPPDTLAKDTGL